MGAGGGESRQGNRATVAVKQMEAPNLTGFMATRPSEALVSPSTAPKAIWCGRSSAIGAIHGPGAASTVLMVRVDICKLRE